MGDESSMCFSILINGSTIVFFMHGRGLRQGCPLPPSLFLTMVKGLSSIRLRGPNHSRG
jgi:hypothetical protein